MATRSRANSGQKVHDSRHTADELAQQLGLWATGGGSLYRRLADAITRLVAEGTLRGGFLLPPERSLATALSLSRGTVVHAYQTLAEQGLVERIQGSGTRITAPVVEVAEPAERLGDPLFTAAPESIDLLVAHPSIPERVLEVARSIDLTQYRHLLDDIEPAGLAPLRQRLADRYTAQGLPTSPQEILITAGAQQGIMLLALLLITPGEVLVREASTWPGLIDNVTRLGGKSHAVAMDHQGVLVDDLQQAIERFRPAFVALNPHHHNPTGTRLSPERRHRVAELSVAYDVPIVEDRVMAELAFDGQVPLPLAAHAATVTTSTAAGGSSPNRCIVVDSLSKVGWPGLRVGWIRAEGQLVSRLRPLRAMVDMFSSVTDQILAMAILDQLDTITAERTDQLRVQADALVDALGRHLPAWSFTPPRGGMVLLAELPRGSASAFARHAARFGVEVAGSRHFGAADDRHIRLPFTKPPEALEEGVRRLGRAWEHFDTRFPSPAETVCLM